MALGRGVMSLVVMALAPLTTVAAQAEPVGRVVATRDPARLTRDGQTIMAAEGANVFEGDRIEAVSPTRVELHDGSTLVLSRGSVMSVTIYQPTRRTAALKLWFGRLWAHVASGAWGGAGFEVQTDNAVAGVRGTTLVVEFYDGTTRVQVLVGEVMFSSTNSEAVHTLRDGQAGSLDTEGRLRIYALDINELGKAERTGEQEKATYLDVPKAAPPIPAEALEPLPTASPHQ